VKVLNSLLMAVLVFAGAANAQTAKPNIVVIMLDDARLDDLAVMTKTNRIFSAGTAFANFYVPLAGAAPPERLTSPVSIPTTMGEIDARSGLVLGAMRRSTCPIIDVVRVPFVY